MKTLEEITYDAGRHALAEQEALVAGIRQRTGTLLAAHALVASFLGAATIRADGLRGWALAALTEQAGAEAEAGTFGWLVAAGVVYQELRARNASKVRWMSGLSALLGLLVVVQALAWIVGLVG